MGINNVGANSVYHGVQTQFSNSIVNGIDVFTAGSGPPPGTNYLTSSGVQPFSITISVGQTTGTYTLPLSVGSGALMIWDGENPSITNMASECFARLSINTTTGVITATRNTGTAGTVLVNGCVIDGDTANLIKNIQYGTITVSSTSGTDTTLPFTPDAIHLLGWSSTNNVLAGTVEYPILTVPGNVPTATRQLAIGTLTVGYVAVQFQPAALNQPAQPITATSSAGVTSYTFPLPNNVVMANTILIYAGHTIAAATSNLSTIYQRGALTAVGTVTVNVNSPFAQAKKYNAFAIEFIPAVFASSVQRGTTTLSPPIQSNSTVLSSFNAAYTAVSLLGSTTNVTNATLNNAECAVSLSSANVNLVQDSGVGGNGTSLQPAFPVGVTTGNTIAVCISGNPDTATVSSVVDDKGQNYIQVPNARSTDSNNGTFADWWYFPNSVAGVQTVTTSLSGTNGSFVGSDIYEIFGAGASPALTGANITNGASTATPVSSPITTTGAAFLMVGLAGGDTSATVNPPYDYPDNGIGASVYTIQPSAVTANSATFNLPVANSYATSTLAININYSNAPIVVTARNGFSNSVTDSWEAWPFKPFS